MASTKAGFSTFTVIFAVALLVGHCSCFQKWSHGKLQRDQYLEAPVGIPTVNREEWDKLLSENLGKDMAPWVTKAPLSPDDIPRLHQSLIDSLGGGMAEMFQLILIYNNRIYYPNRTDVENAAPPANACPHAAAFHRKVTALLSSGRRTLPNVLFVYSFDDNRPRFCAPNKEFCQRAPLFSQIKTVGEDDGDDLDILIPQWMFTHSSLYIYPWHLKQDLAFFRGEPYCSGYWGGRYRCFDACPRTALAQLSQIDRASGKNALLDVAMVEPAPRLKEADGSIPPHTCLKMDLPVADRVSIPEHSYYKWLLHLEGITASSRLSQLMLVNSLVVMQRQPFIEYFYRSLKPDVHYVPFWNASNNWHMDDIYEVIKDLQTRDTQDPESVQRIIREAQNFALKFTMPYSKLQYLKHALYGYRSLFPDMDSFLEKYVKELRQRGFQIK